MPHTYTCTGGIKCREVHERVKITCLWVVVMRDNFLMFFLNFPNSLQWKWVAFLKKKKEKHVRNVLEITMEFFTE